jgi:hypothetical protein
VIDRHAPAEEYDPDLERFEAEMRAIPRPPEEPWDPAEDADVPY